MSRVREYLALVDDPRQGLEPGHPADDALIGLLAHVAFADGTVDDRELDFLRRVLPGRDAEELRAWAKRAGATDLDLDRVAQVLPSVDDRWTCLRFATRMAFKDGVLDDPERAILESLADRLQLPAGALERVVSEMTRRVEGAVAPGDIQLALKGTPWKAAQHGTGDVHDDKLAALIPEGASVIGRVGLDDVEVLIVLDAGLVGRFREGPAFVPWDDVVGYTRVPTLDAAIDLLTESGQRFGFVDHRMVGLRAFLDRLFYPDEDHPTRATPPVIEQVRGDEGDDW